MNDEELDRLRTRKELGGLAKVSRGTIYSRCKEGFQFCGKLTTLRAWLTFEERRSTRLQGKSARRTSV